MILIYSDNPESIEFISDKSNDLSGYEVIDRTNKIQWEKFLTRGYRDAVIHGPYPTCLYTLPETSKEDSCTLALRRVSSISEAELKRDSIIKSRQRHANIEDFVEALLFEPVGFPYWFELVTAAEHLRMFDKDPEKMKIYWNNSLKPKLSKEFSDKVEEYATTFNIPILEGQNSGL